MTSSPEKAASRSRWTILPAILRTRCKTYRPMPSTYLFFKFLHIAAAIIWIGGVLMLGAVQERLARTQDRDALLALSTHTEFFGRTLVGPSALLTLITGVVMVAVSGLSFGSFWVTWGFIGIFVTMFLGGFYARRIGEKLNALIANDPLDDPHIRTLQRRMTLLNVVNLLILFSVVWAMVFKPTL